MKLKLYFGIIFSLNLEALGTYPRNYIAHIINISNWINALKEKDKMPTNGKSAADWRQTPSVKAKRSDLDTAALY